MKKQGKKWTIWILFMLFKVNCAEQAQINTYKYKSNEEIDIKYEMNVLIVLTLDYF